MRKKITQCRVGPHLKYFKEDFLNKWGLTDYTSLVEPCIFFGGTSNFEAIQKHKGFKVILTAGPTDNIDWSALNDKSNTAIITGQNKFKVPQEIIFKQELIQTKDFSLYRPNVLGDKVYYYSGLDCPNGEHPDFIKRIEDACGYEIITTFFEKVSDYKSPEWLKKNFYDKCFLNLNFRYPDTGMTTNKELGLMGRRTVMNSHYYGELYKGMITFENGDDVVRIIKEEAKKIGTIQESIDSHTMVTDEWLYIDFYKKEKTMGDMNSGIKPRKTIHNSAKIHPLAYIEDNVSIGENTEIGPFCIVRSGAIIGNNCKFTAYCEIRNNVIIGDGTTMGSRCTISANGTIGKNTTIKYGFVLTDTPNLKEGNVKSVKGIGDNVLIGANVTLMPSFSIGNNSIIGACSQVRANVPNNEIWYGSPAKFFKKND